MGVFFLCRARHDAAGRSSSWNDTPAAGHPTTCASGDCASCQNFPPPVLPLQSRRLLKPTVKLTSTGTAARLAANGELEQALWRARVRVGRRPAHTRGQVERARRTPAKDRCAVCAAAQQTPQPPRFFLHFDSNSSSLPVAFTPLFFFQSPCFI